MPTKKLNDTGGLVYSSNAEATERNRAAESASETLEPAQQDLRILIDRKIKGGKAATIIYKFVGKTEDLEALAKRLKQGLSVGGSTKDGEIILQGDCRDRACALLAKWGYRFKKAGG